LRVVFVYILLTLPATLFYSGFGWVLIKMHTIARSQQSNRLYGLKVTR
jgi:hypothetical protein